MAAAIKEMNQEMNIEVIEAKTWEDQEIDAIVSECKQKGIRSVGGFAQRMHFIIF